MLTAVSILALLNPAWKGVGVKARTLDLRSAYKQLGVHSSDLPLSVTSMHWTPWGEVAFFVSLSLPFGAVTSVYAFNKCSRCIEIVLNKVMKAACSSYFDDYYLIEPDLTSDMCTLAIETFFKLIGRTFDDRDQKYQPFADNLVVLGGVMEIKGDHFLMYNKPERLLQIGNEVDLILSKGICKSSLLSTLAGRLNFAKTLVAGRPLTPALVTPYEAMAKDAGNIEIDDQIRGALETIQAYVRNSKPRRIDCTRVLSPLFFYTDGAVEGSWAGAAAILYDPDGDSEFLDFVIDEGFLAEWAALGSSHAVTQCELLPALVARLVWADRLQGRDLLHFTDNAAVKDILVKGSSSSLSCRKMAFRISAEELALNMRSWVCRVPSESNPADAPSRGKTDELHKVLSLRACLAI